jgi:hypothetical protein
MKNTNDIAKLNSHSPLPGNENGMTLAVTLMLIAVLVLLGSTAVTTVTTDLKIASNYRENARALYNAEAGVHAVIAKIDEGGFTWPAAEDASTTITVTQPDGYTFDNGTEGDRNISVRYVDGTHYRFQITGRGAGNASKTIEAHFKRAPAFEFGLFADKEVDLKSSIQVYSYNSNTTPKPDSADYPDASTKRGDVGSNTEILADNGTYISGDIGLGASSGGTEASYSSTGTSTVTGSTDLVGRVDPDPLGAAAGGELDDKFTTYSVTNDNASAKPDGVIDGTTINAGNGDTVTLVGKEGGANYYITELTLGNKATLVVDTTKGPVNIYLTGALEAKTGSTINVDGLPTQFSIFSNSSDKIVFKNSGEFKGTVYAPLAPIEMKNGADAYGLIWGGTIDIKNSGRFFFDEALNDTHQGKDVIITAWRDVM